MLSDITVSHAPHISKPMSTRTMMLDVIIGLVPAMVAAGYFFRSYALTLTATCVITAVVTEYVCNILLKKDNPFESLGDFSAVVTGIILAFSIPPALPVWAAVIGSVFAIAIGKMVFGGLGANIFNPAMVGRAFLMASFGVLMTTWTVPATIYSEMPQIVTSATQKADIRTQATPLSFSKQAIKAGQKAKEYAENNDEIGFNNARREAIDCVTAVESNLKFLFLGNVGGCLGETSVLALLIGAIYLLIRKTISFHIPVAVLLSAYGFAFVFNWIDGNMYISPSAHILSGGLLIGAFFIATDPVTAPASTKGMWIFGIGVGTITMLIRIVGEYPEGVMFSILLMNAVTPLIDRFCKLVPAGGKPNV